MTDPGLFDATPYEDPNRKVRKPRQRPREQAIKLIPPWVLLRHHKQRPLAHLALNIDSVVKGMDPKTRRAFEAAFRRDGTPKVIPRCAPKQMFAQLVFDPGEHPLAPVCKNCLDYALMNRIPAVIVERPTMEER